MILKTVLAGKSYAFRDSKDVLAKANEEKTGDKLAGLAAENARERVAAKVVLSAVTLGDLRENPAVPYEHDEVTRIIQDDVNEAVYNKIRGWTVSELREWLLAETTTGKAGPTGDPTSKKASSVSFTPSMHRHGTSAESCRHRQFPSAFAISASRHTYTGRCPTPSSTAWARVCTCV